MKELYFNIETGKRVIVTHIGRSKWTFTKIIHFHNKDGISSFEREEDFLSNYLKVN